MADCLTFPDTLDEFLDQYQFKDSEGIYTNGSMLIPVFRVRQWHEHAADVRESVKGVWIQHYETTSDNETLPYGWECSLCGRWEMEKQPFCNCGAQMGGAEDGE